MNCGVCGHSNPNEARFCVSCGNALRSACPHCGHPIEPDYAFCPTCGYALTRRPVAPPDSYTPAHLAHRILATRDDVVGERKRVTVLFADVVDSTALVEGRDPEDAAEFLGTAVRGMIEAVHRYEGTVAKALGDGIMAVFGAPLAVEDHAVRACLAALAMGPQVATATDGKIDVRVGLHSGEVLVKAVGHDLAMEFEALGPTVHLASRMESLAEAGSPRLTEATHRLVEGFVETDLIGSVAVKGITEPVAIYALLGRTEHSTLWEARAARGLTAFAGRKAELTALAEDARRATGGRGRVVAIVGEAGVGKSRLSHEFLGSAAMAVHECGASPYDIATSYYPLKTLLRSWLDLSGDVASAVEAVDPGLSGAAPALSALLDIGDPGEEWLTTDPGARRRATRDAIKALVLANARQEPIALLIEDLHWIDAESLAVVEEIADSVGGASILLLLTYRPTFQHDWSAIRHFSRLLLEPLADVEAADFLDTLLGEDASVVPLKPLLAARAGGTPLFIEESVRSMEESGVLVGTKGAYRAVREPSALDIPDSVQAVVTARIDRLPADLKETLQVGAVVGELIPQALVAAMHEGEDTLERLRALQHRGLLYETRVFPEREYAFKHNLIREAAYGEMARAHRRRLHGELLDVMESDPARYGDSLERLAYHAARAEQWEKSVHYAESAVTRALDRSAYNDAGLLLKSAIRSLEQLPTTPDTQRARIDARLRMRVVATGGTVTFTDAAEMLDEAEPIAEEIGDTRRLYLIRLNRAWIAGMTGGYEQALESADRARRLAPELGDHYYEAEAQLAKAQALTYAGRFRESEAILTSDLDYWTGPLRFEQRGHIATRSIIALGHLGAALAMLGKDEAAEKVLAEGREIVQVHRRPFDMSWFDWSDGFAHFASGDLQQAVALFDRAAAIAEEHDIPFMSAWAAPIRARAHAVAGDGERALRLLEDARRWVAQTKIAYLAGWIDVYEADTLGEMGRASEALEAGERALAAGVLDGSVLMEIMARMALSRLVEPAAAAEYLVTALHLSAEQGLSHLATACRRRLEELGHGSGR